MKMLWPVSILFFSLACANTHNHQAENTPVESDELLLEITPQLLPNDSPTSLSLSSARLGKARAFKAILIAGSSENANFLQELLWNYAWLQDKGIHAKDIGCFYAQPDVLQYTEDKAQFDELKELIAICHPNDRDLILESVRLSLQLQPTDFYFYMTSHGSPPVPRKQQPFYQKNCFSYAPSLVLDQEPSTCASKRGLTPDDLSVVMKIAPKTRKYLVLQGCFTGGFISSADDAKREPSALALLPNISIITASSARHASFGCNPGARSTLFGYAYGREVIDNKQGLDDINWQQVYTNVSKTVSFLEKELRLSKADASNPQFFTN